MNHLEKERFDARIPELDGIRGIAILTIVFVHYWEIPQGGGWLVNAASTILSFFWSGVDLFFVLSGFLLGGILIDNRYAPNYFRAFYARRICRIFPLYYLWLGLFYFLPLLLPKGFLGNLSFERGFFHFPKWGYLLFLQNFYTKAIDDFDALWMGLTWSIAIEEQFYLILPTLMWFVLPRKPLRTLVVLIALAPVFRTVVFLLPSSHLIYVLLPSRADALLIGVLCAYLLRQEKSRSWLAQNTKTLHTAFLFLALGVAYLMSLGYGYNAMKVRNSFELVTYGYTLLALFCASVLLIAILDKKSLIARVLRNRLLRHFGILAYGIYIIHSAVRGILLELFFGSEGAGATMLSRDLVSLLAFFTMWFLAMLSWRYFEGPIVRWGRSFRYAPEKAVQKEASIPNAP